MPGDSQERREVGQVGRSSALERGFSAGGEDQLIGAGADPREFQGGGEEVPETGAARQTPRVPDLI